MSTPAAAAPIQVATRHARRDVLVDRAARLLLYAVLIAGALLFVAPPIWLVGTSLKPEDEVFLLPPSLVGSRLELSNYPQALTTFPFLRAFGNTMLIVLGVEVGRLLSSSLAAFAFARLRFPLRGALFVLVLSTMM